MSQKSRLLESKITGAVAEERLNEVAGRILWSSPGHHQVHFAVVVQVARRQSCRILVDGDLGARVEIPCPISQEDMDKVILLAMGHDREVLFAIAVQIGGSEALAVSKILQFGWRKNESALPVTKIDENDSLIRAVHRKIKLSVVVEIGQNSAVGSAFSSDQVIAGAEPTQTIAQMNFRVIAPVGAIHQIDMPIPVEVTRREPLGQSIGRYMPIQSECAQAITREDSNIVESSHIDRQVQITVLVQIARYEKLGQGQAAGSVVAKGRRQKDRRKNEARES